MDEVEVDSIPDIPVERPDKSDPVSEEPSRGDVVDGVVLRVVEPWLACDCAALVAVVLAAVLDPPLLVLEVSLG